MLVSSACHAVDDGEKTRADGLPCQDSRSLWRSLDFTALHWCLEFVQVGCALQIAGFERIHLLLKGLEATVHQYS